MPPMPPDTDTGAPLPQDPELTQQARAGIRQVAWSSLATGALGVSAISLLGAAGLAPLLAAVGFGTLSQGALTQWLVSLGGNVIAGWVGNLSLWATGRALVSKDPSEAQAAQRDLAAKLDTLLAQDANAAAGLARLLQSIDAVPQSLAALQDEVSAQSDRILAQPYLERALEICERVLGPTHPLTTIW